MSDKSIVEQIKHYQRDIIKSPDNLKRMIRCIERLTVLPVTIAHLQETGVGRSVNELRKCGGEVGAAANALVCKWKSMVKDEEEDEESVPESDAEIDEPKELHNSSSADYKHSSSKKPESSSADYKHSSSKKNESSSADYKHSSYKKPESSSADYKHSSSQKPESTQNHKQVDKSEDHRKSVSSHSSNKKTEPTYSESTSSKNSEQQPSKSDHKSHKEKLSKSEYSSSSDSKYSSSHKSKIEHDSRSHKKPHSRHTSESECNGSIKSEKSHSKTKYDDHKSSKPSSVSKVKDSKSNDIKQKNDKEKHRREESSHKHTSSKRYDLKRIDSDSSDDDTVYKPSNRKRKKSSSDEEQKYESKKYDKKSYKESVKKRRYESSEESNVSESNEEDDHDSREQLESRNNSESDEEGSNRSDAEDVSDNEPDSEGRSSSEESEEQNKSCSENNSDSEGKSSPEIEKYVPVKIKREKESPPRHSKSYSSEKSKSNHVKDSHYSSSHSRNHKTNSASNKKEHGYEDIKIKKEKTEKDDSHHKQKESKSSGDKKPHKSSSSHAQSSKKHSSKPDKKVKVKIEKEEDGSIDCESGASFADALLGLSDTKKKPVKKKSTTPTQEKSPSITKKSSDTKLHSSSASEIRSSSSSKSIFKEPDLLSKNVKLEPLDVDLKSTLPEISPHYKPLPHFSPPDSPAHKKTKLLSHEEALSTIMSTKNQRTKVFSGNKTGFTKVPSLFDLCIQILRENIEALEYTGGVPYDLLKPVLDRATPDQLYQLEHYNAYLVEDTDGLWQFHCNKDFRGKKPDEFETWRELYLRLLDEREKKLEALKANITQSMAKSTPIRQTKLAYVDSVVKPPRNVARKQVKYGTSKAVKHDLVSKAMVGAASSSPAPEVVSVPAPSRSTSSNNSFPIPNFLKKKKAPLMAKTLQLIKGNRFKR